MPGGRFTNGVSKVLPGTYINFESGRKLPTTVGNRGRVIIPVIGSDYGPAEQFIKLTKDSPDAEEAVLGHSIYEAGNHSMLLLREAIKRSQTVYAYILTEGEKATADIEMTLEEVEHSDACNEIVGILKEKIGVNPEQKGVVIGFNTRTNTATVSLTTNVLTQISGTGIVTALQALNTAGYTVIKIDGVKLEGTDKMALLSSPLASKLGSISKGGPAIPVTVEVGKDEENLETFTVNVDYPKEPPASKQGPIVDPNEGNNTLKATAKSGGTRGNALTVTVDANPVKGYDVIIHLAGDKVAQYDNLETVEELIALADPYIDFEGSGELGAAAGTNLAGGTDKEVTNDDITKFIDAWDSVRFDTVCFPFDGEKSDSLKAAAVAKVKFLRENMGRSIQAVIPNIKKADYEGIINVTNSVEVDGIELTTAEACAWVAGATAGASNVESLTYKPYDGATKVVNPLTQEQAVNAVNNGEFFFTISEQDKVVVMYDINSLVTLANKKDKTYSKNRVIRVYDTLQTEIQTQFAPNMFDNTETGWDIMEGIGKSILQSFSDAGAIINVDFDTDFKVDRTKSKDDETFFNVGIQAADSAEKLYFTVTTR